MKKSNLFFLSITFTVISIIFYSCGDNTTSPSGNNSPLFSADSFSIWLGPSGFSAKTDSIVYQLQDTTIRRVQIEYTIQSNADSIHGAGLYGVVANSITILPPPVFVYHPIDQYFTFTIDIPAQFHAKWLLSLVCQNNTFPYYIRFKSLKIFKI